MYNYTKDSYFNILDSKCRKILLTEYPDGNYKSAVEYKYDNAIRFVVKKFDGTTKVYYL